MVQLSFGGLASAACSLSALSQLAFPTTCGNGTPFAHSDEGPVTGYVDGHGSHVFLGIPFADTTAGEGRWAPPRPVKKRTEVFKATKFGDTCPQGPSNDQYAPQGEDCLNLNIWTPSSGKGHAVMVYFFGGAMVYGGSSRSVYNGTRFPSKGVIAVTVNYRPNLFGAPHSPEQAGESTNFGILDVFAAVEWVQKNIQAFGGDPLKITLFGQSSGGVMVDHYLWNHPTTTISGAIIQSATVFSGPNCAPPGVGLDTLAKVVGCPSHVEGGQLACMRAKPYQELLTEKFNSTYATWHTPTIDNHTRFHSSEYPKRFAKGLYPKHVPVLLGHTDAEATLFGSVVYASQVEPFSRWSGTYNADAAHIPNQELEMHYKNGTYATFLDKKVQGGALYANMRFVCAIDYLNDVRAAEAPTWRYRWFGDYPASELGPLGATHGSELPYIFGGTYNHSLGDDLTAAVADHMLTIWTHFAKNPQAGPGWPRSSPRNGTMALLGYPGRDTEIVVSSAGAVDVSWENNAICQNFHNLWQPAYPKQMDPRDPSAY